MYDQANRVPRYAIGYDPLPDEKTTYVSKVSDSNFSVVGFEIHLHRRMQPFAMNVFVPSGTLMVISFIGFLIPVEQERVLKLSALHLLY